MMDDKCPATHFLWGEAQSRARKPCGSPPPSKVCLPPRSFPPFVPPGISRDLLPHTPSPRVPGHLLLSLWSSRLDTVWSHCGHCARRGRGGDGDRHFIEMILGTADAAGKLPRSPRGAGGETSGFPEHQADGSPPRFLCTVQLPSPLVTAQAPPPAPARARE